MKGEGDSVEHRKSLPSTSQCNDRRTIGKKASCVVQHACWEDIIRVFKKTNAFMAKLKILFNETPTEATKKDEFCNDTLKEDGGVKTQGFNSLYKEIKSVNILYSLDDVWDENNGILEPTGYTSNDLKSSIDFCSLGPSPGPSA